jgi:methyl-accepting chemotaxis protein
MKIGIKLVVVISALSIFGIGVLATVSMYFTRSEIEKLATENAANIARQNSEMVGNWLSMYMDATRTMGEVMSRFQEVPLRERRAFCDNILKGVMSAHPELTGVWSVWASNALDGLDSEYVNTDGSDASGRYIPYWSGAAGKLLLEPIVGYETNDYYNVPMKTGNECIIDPYLYQI